MSARVHVGLKDFGKRLQRLGPEIEQRLRAGLLDGAMRIQAQVQTEIATSQPHKPVDTGVYAAAFESKRTHDGAVMGNKSPQGAWVEVGRRKGPVSKEGQQHLADWVRRKKLYLDILPAVQRSLRASRPGPLGKDGRAKLKADSVTEACARVAFLIARKIAREGYDPRFPVGRAVRHAPITKDLRDALKGLKP